VGLAQMGELLANASWNSTAWLVVACIFSMSGPMLAVRFMPVSPGAAPRPPADGASSPWRFALVVAVTGWGAFLACFKAFYPVLEPGFSAMSVVQPWSVEVGAATLVALIAAR
jgi:hypothetical protein